ncbi:unnamed protein product [Thlaspi arvense]|uniref:Uncharacterized protein n=1 Tax=Thlaspi arvense TaxID=13288 RepID=A0AAU9TCE2_THLAR|nr:unnamed protein product [Thlaspi arvense]
MATQSMDCSLRIHLLKTCFASKSPKLGLSPSDALLSLFPVMVLPLAWVKHLGR